MVWSACMMANKSYINGLVRMYELLWLTSAKIASYIYISFEVFFGC